jgi:sirohydrochlorin ferrochelatase
MLETTVPMGEPADHMRTAVIVLFHGSRAEGAADAASRVVAAVRQDAGFDSVMPAFLQHAKPDLTAAVERCIAEHASLVIIVPFFLQTGMHVTADIPVIVRRLREAHPDVTIRVTDAVGSHPLMAQIVADLVRQGVDKDGPERKD